MRGRLFIFGLIIIGFAIFGFSNAVIALAKINTIVGDMGVVLLCVCAFLILVGPAWSGGYEKGKSEAITKDDVLDIVNRALKMNANYTAEALMEISKDPTLQSDEHVEAFLSKKRDEFSDTVKDMIEEAAKKKNSES
jgi:hypothetical protein